MFSFNLRSYKLAKKYSKTLFFKVEIIHYISRIVVADVNHILKLIKQKKSIHYSILVQFSGCFLISMGKINFQDYLIDKCIKLCKNCV